MTLIAFATRGDHAVILTDTASYTPTLRRMQHCSKVLQLPHLNMVLMTQGNSDFGSYADFGAAELSRHAPDFDAFADYVQVVLHGAWEEVVADYARAGADVPPSTAFIVGYSPAAEGFVAYGFASEDGFLPWVVDGLHIMPSPFSIRPSDVELGRLAERMHSDDIEVLKNQPIMAPPEETDDWIALALYARKQRACPEPGSPYKSVQVIIHGDLFMMQLERDLSQTVKLWEFNETDEDFQRMIAETHHPQAQLGPCFCGSGDRFIDCHLVEVMDIACECGSGVAFKDCCRMPDADRPPSQTDPQTDRKAQP